MSPSTPITAAQRRVLEFVQTFRLQRGFSPTCGETSTHFGWKSPNAAHDHFQALVKRGLITRQSGTARSLRVTLAGAAMLGQSAAVSALPVERLILLPVVDMNRLGQLAMDRRGG